MKKNLREMGRAILNTLLLIYSLLSIYPILWMIMNSFKENSEFMVNNMSFPTKLIFMNYLNAFKTSKMNIYYINSIVASTFSISLIVIFIFYNWVCIKSIRFLLVKKLLYMVFFIFGMLIPTHSLLIPLFTQFKLMGLLNSRAALILTYCGYNLPAGIFLVEGFMHSVPRALEEAAYIDGASMARTMVRIILPMTKPVLVTSVILAFINIWNEMPFALVLASKDSLRTIPIGLANFSGEFSVNYTQLLAGSILATLPVIIVYALFNSQIVKGMVSGSVKG